jgi:hypothetical protein
MYGPDYIMLARSDDGDESNIDVETATFFSGATGRQLALGCCRLRGVPEPLTALLGVVCCLLPPARAKA